MDKMTQEERALRRELREAKAAEEAILAEYGKRFEEAVAPLKAKIDETEAALDKELNPKIQAASARASAAYVNLANFERNKQNDRILDRLGVKVGDTLVEWSRWGQLNKTGRRGIVEVFDRTSKRPRHAILPARGSLIIRIMTPTGKPSVDFVTLPDAGWYREGFDPN